MGKLSWKCSFSVNFWIHNYGLIATAAFQQDLSAKNINF